MKIRAILDGPLNCYLQPEQAAALVDVLCVSGEEEKGNYPKNL